MRSEIQGMLCGFRKSIKIKVIQCVELHNMFRECDFLCLVDGSQYEFDRARKDSFIGFPHTEEGLAFLRSFWDGDIDEMKDTDYV